MARRPSTHRNSRALVDVSGRQHPMGRGPPLRRWCMTATERLQASTVRRAASFTAVVLALLSAAAGVFCVVALADAVGAATGFGLERPLMSSVGALLTGVGVVGSSVAARSAWRWPAHARPMVVAAALGLAAACLGGVLVLRSYAFYFTPRVAEIVLEHEGSAATAHGPVGLRPGEKVTAQPDVSHSDRGLRKRTASATPRTTCPSCGVRTALEMGTTASRHGAATPPLRSAQRTKAANHVA